MEQLRMLTLGLAFFIALASVALSAKSASAQDIMPTWAKWAFDLTVNGGHMDGQWHVTVGGEDKAGDPVALHTETFHIPCRTVGDVKADGSVLQFAGGHVECDFPDLIATANAIIADKWGKQYMLNVGGDCECAPIKLGYATIDATPAEEGTNPVFHHPDIAAALHVDKSGVRSKFRFAQEQAEGVGVPLSQNATLTSRYYCDRSHGACFFEHLADGAMLKQEKRVFVPANFITGAVTVQIGHDPQNGASFTGTVRTLSVDPGCRVN